MDTPTYDNTKTVKDGEFPFYEDEPITPMKIPQGHGSGLDAETINNIQAVTAAKFGPNKLVATDMSGLLPSSILPPNITTIAITNRTGTQLYRLWVEDNGALSYDPV